MTKNAKNNRLMRRLSRKMAPIPANRVIHSAKEKIVKRWHEQEIRETPQGKNG